MRQQTRAGETGGATAITSAMSGKRADRGQDEMTWAQGEDGLIGAVVGSRKRMEAVDDADGSAAR